MSTVPQLKIIIKLEKKTGSRNLANNENRAPPLPTAPPHPRPTAQDSHPNSPNMVKTELKGQSQPRKTVLCVWTPSSEASLQERRPENTAVKGRSVGSGGRDAGTRRASEPLQVCDGAPPRGILSGAPCPTHYTQAS